MPRQARRKSESGIYHILMRGINRQIIFEDENDSKAFLETIGLYKAKYNCQIYAYCLMNNHVHLLIRIDPDKLHQFMRKVSSKYVYWYNWKYNRVGGLFQDRYKSEPVEDEGYFLTVLQYIHQNPVKAGICGDASAYKGSSINDYIHPRTGQITDTEFALTMLGGEAQFIKYSKENINEKCLELQENVRVDDSEAKTIISDVSRCDNIAEFQALPCDIRNRYLAALKEKGLPIRQIERLTGINRGLVQRA